MIDLRMFGGVLTTIKMPNEYGIQTKYVVDEVFPYFVKCHSETGRTECFNAGDLMKNGVLKNKGVFE